MPRLTNPFKWAAELIDKGFDVPDALRKASSASSCGAICVPGFTLKAINESIAEAEGVPGTSINFPPGQYDLEDTGITILGDGIVLDSQSPRFVGSELFGVELIYSGTGAAVTLGSSAKVAHYRNEISNIQIRAEGAAKTNANAIGLKTVNQHYLSSSRLALKDFEASRGLQMTSAGAGAFGALNTFYEILTHRCKIGIQTVGVDTSIKENAATFVGGATIGLGQAGEIGCDLDQYSSGFIFYGTDFESSEIGVRVAGTSHRFIGSRTEFNTLWGIQVTATAVRTHIIGHGWAGSVGETATLSDSGNTTYRIDERGFFNCPIVLPTTDKTEVFLVAKADKTPVFDISTSGAKPSIDIPNGTDVIGWSDNFSTQTFKITNSSGNVQATNYTATGTPFQVAAGQISIGGAVGTTVGAAGTASALPALPTGYIDIYVAGVAQKIPYYN